MYVCESVLKVDLWLYNYFNLTEIRFHNYKSAHLTFSALHVFFYKIFTIIYNLLVDVLRSKGLLTLTTKPLGTRDAKTDCFRSMLISVADARNCPVRNRYNANTNFWKIKQQIGCLNCTIEA